MIPKSISKADLSALIGRQPDNADLLSLLIQTVFAPRFIRTPDAALTLTAKMAGACFLVTSESPVTVTLPTGMESGFMCSFLPIGSGTITFSGSVVGGTTSGGQYKMCSALVLDDLSWILLGSVA